MARPKKPATTRAALFRDRVKGLARLPAARIEGAAKNFRTHDDRQRRALDGVLAPLGGLLLAFVVYDIAHLAAHGLAPFPFAEALRRHHARHHADDTRNFGVTTPWIDCLLGTRAP